MVVEDDDQVCVSFARSLLKPTNAMLTERCVSVCVVCSLPGAAGPGAGAHLCVPAGQLQELQAPVEVRGGEPRLLPPAPARHGEGQPQRLHPAQLALQIQVSGARG